MIKVLHIIDSGGLYGAEVMLLNLIAEQIKMGLDPTIVSIGEKHIKEKRIETEALKRGFKVKKFRMFPGPNIAGAFKILQYAKSNGFDLLHSHGYKGNVAFGFMPRKFRKIPLVSTAHGWTSTKGLTKNRIYEWLDTLSFKFIDAVVLVSNVMKYHPKLKNLKGINFHVIPNGIPVSKSSPPSQHFSLTPSISPPSHHPTISTSSSTPSHLPNFSSSDKSQSNQSIIDFCSKGFTIGSIGRLSHEKGYKYLIEALRLLLKDGSHARLVIIGEGYERNNLENLVKQLGLSDKVLLPGYRSDAKKYLPYFNVFVISSLTEGLPMTLLEAMQAKIPVVATTVGAIPEVLQNGAAGVLFEPCSSKALAKAITSIYRNREKAKQLTTAAYERAINDYSSEKMTEQYLAIYQKVLEYTRLN